ncbi:MAG TPA: hypothetical protein VEA69_19340 [Tepidisphaeraceae bacterium]|nr:hypothetical protein [Tepidisphaeraceae bacterium]
MTPPPQRPLDYASAGRNDARRRSPARIVGLALGAFAWTVIATEMGWLAVVALRHPSATERPILLVPTLALPIMVGYAAIAEWINLVRYLRYGDGVE